MLRSPLRTSQLSRPTFLVILLATAAVLFLFNASTSNLNPSYGSRGIDARVGWNSDTYGEDDQLGFARKAGQALSGFGDRIGRLAGGKPPAKSKSTQASASGLSGSFRSLFERTGGSLYEVIIWLPVQRSSLTEMVFVPLPYSWLLFPRAVSTMHEHLSTNYVWLQLASLLPRHPLRTMSFRKAHAESIFLSQEAFQLSEDLSFAICYF